MQMIPGRTRHGPPVDFQKPRPLPDAAEVHTRTHKQDLLRRQSPGASALRRTSSMTFESVRAQKSMLLVRLLLQVTSPIHARQVMVMVQVRRKICTDAKCYERRRDSWERPTRVSSKRPCTATYLCWTLTAAFARACRRRAVGVRRALYHAFRHLRTSHESDNGSAVPT